MARTSREHRASSRGTLLRVAAIVGLVALLPVVALVLVICRGGGGEDDDGLSAAIIDQLSLTAPNPDFADDAAATLEAAGYDVDYYPGEEVTVEFYRRLPYLEYDVLVFRSHADRLEAIDDSGQPFDQVVLFTSEPYTTERYQQEQTANDLVIARYEVGGNPFFGIAAGFIEGVGRDFGGAHVIMMGCEGMLNDSTARAFIERGAASYVSWDEAVTASHTDAATSVLLDNLVANGLSPVEAVDRTMAELGPDPLFGSRLVAYPPEG